MDADTVIRFIVPLLGILGTLAVTLVGIVIKRLYGSIDLLFAKIEILQKQVNALKLIAMRENPESTALFSALTGNGTKP